MSFQIKSYALKLKNSKTYKLNNLLNHTLVDDASTLALTALDGVRLFQLHLRADAEHVLQPVRLFLLECIDFADGVEGLLEVFLTDFHLNGECIEIVHAIHDEHVARSKFFHTEHHAFHL